MPSKFSKQEQKIIKAKLIKKAKDYFSKYGFTKTSVKELTDAAGISKGSFYNFFDSKEELFLEVMEEQEKFRNQIMAEILEKNLDAQTAIEHLFRETLKIIDKNRIFQTIYEENLIEKMLRKVPQERVEKHHEQDLKDGKKFIKYLQKNSNLVDEPPEIIIGLFRALYFITLYKDEIGTNIYGDVMNLLIQCISRGLTKTEENANDNC